MKYNYHTLYCFLTAIFLCHFVQAQEIVATENLRLRDPFITVDRDNACYYLIHSRWKDGRGGLFALRSQDLEHWEKTGFVYNAPEDYLGTDDWWRPIPIRTMATGTHSSRFAMNREVFCGVRLCSARPTVRWDLTVLYCRPNGST